MADKKIIIKIVNGRWYATLDGKHLTAQKTAEEIAKGTTYIFENLGIE